MVRRVRVAMVAAVVPIGLLTGCSSDHHRSGVAKVGASVSSSHRTLPADDSTDAGKPGTVAVAAANAVTGRFLWRVPASGDFQVFSGMVLTAETLYGQWAECIDRHNAGVAAIDVGTGRVRWRTAKLYRGEAVPDSWALSALGGVYVAMGATDTGTRIVGIDVADGELRWSRAISGGQGGGAAALDRAVVAVTTDRTVTALDRATYADRP